MPKTATRTEGITILSAQPAPKKRIRRSPEESKYGILQAAFNVFVDRGFDGARVAQIAKTAGIQQGLIYHYFPSKQKLFYAVIDEVFRPFFDAYESDPYEKPCLEHIEKWIRNYFQFLVENPKVTRLYTWCLASHSWLDAPQMHSRADEMTLQLVKDIDQAKEAGVIRQDVDSAGLLFSITGLCEHWNMTAGEFHRCAPEDIPPEAHQTRLDQIVELILRGIRPNTAQN